MKKLIDIDTWNRREYFLFFNSFTDPFFGVTVNVDFTEVYRESKAAELSFFLCSLHHIMKVVNDIEAFRTRIEGEQVVCYDRVHVSTTIGRADGSFGFGFFEYIPDKMVFICHARKEIERVQALSGLCLDEQAGRVDVVRFSPVPWLPFTEMKHASAFRPGDSAPRISTGRLIQEQERFLLPVSVTAHHGLVDGRLVADLFEGLAVK